MIFAVVAALELYVDPVARRRVRALWDAFEAAGVPSLRDLTHGRHQPHLSFATAPMLDPARVRAALDGFPLVPAMTLSLDHVGVFLGRVLFLGAVPSMELLSHHAELVRRLDGGGITVDPFYRPGRWVPHSTMSLRVPHKNMSDAIKLCMDVLPIEARLVGAAVADYGRDVYEKLA
jgi:hypothetical protein